MASNVASLVITDFINEHRFIDSIIVKHSYDPSVEEKCNVNNLLGIVNNILFGAIALVDEHSGSKEIPIIALQTIPTNLSRLINSICCQMTCEATRDKCVRERFLAIFQKLSSYRWTTQVVLVLAAFALQYGDFWYTSEAPSDGGNALSTHLLKGLSSLKKKLISDEDKAVAVIPLNNVVKDLLELTTSLVGLNKLAMQHRGKHVPELATAFRAIPRWSCQTIIAILTAGNYFARLIDDDKLAVSELGILTSSLSDRKSAVLAAAKACEEQLGRMEDYQKYVNKVEAPVDIVDFLVSLLTEKDSLEDPIVTPNDTPVKFESFRKKSVLLIISDLKISRDDIETLKIIHDDSRRFRMGPKEDETRDGSIQIHTEEDQIHTEKETLYELVWIPIVGATLDYLEALPKFKSMMPWAYRVDPHKMNRLAPMYIKEEWRFKGETMVVVLDSFGWVENTYAMPMLRIWGTEAFPYTGNESTHPWRDPLNWVQLVLKKLVVQHETLHGIEKDEFVVFCGGPGAVDVAADIRSGNPNLKAVPIEDTKHFHALLRNCLICRLHALQILKSEKDPLRDHVVYEMSEAFKACQRGGFAILTKGPDLQLQYIGPLSKPKSEDLVSQDRLAVLAEDFKKKYKAIQEQSICLDVCVPHYAGLGDLYCPGCSRFMRYDLWLMCCHSDSD